MENGVEEKRRIGRTSQVMSCHRIVVLGSPRIPLHNQNRLFRQISRCYLQLLKQALRLEKEDDLVDRRPDVGLGDVHGQISL